MLNSRRLPFSPGSVPDQAQLVVDVNLLPMAALERIEILRDGATATYGSDAVGMRDVASSIPTANGLEARTNAPPTRPEGGGCAGSSTRRS